MWCCPVCPQNTPAELTNSTQRSGNTDSTDQSRRCSSETVVIDIKFDVMHDNCISFALACFYVCVFILGIMDTEL
jgi:hypothetical protein